MKQLVSALKNVPSKKATYVAMKSLIPKNAASHLWLALILFDCYTFHLYCIEVLNHS